MKPTLLLIICCLSLSVYSNLPSSIYKERSDLEKEGLLGKVRSVSITEYRGEKPIGILVRKEVLGYNDTRYDERGYATENSTQRYDEELSPEVKTTYQNTYNENGRRVEWRTYNAKDSLLAKILYNYDDNGNILEQATYKPSGWLNLTYKHVYNNKGNIAKSFSYNQNGTLFYTSIFEYDNNDRLVIRKEIRDATTRNTTHLYKYDGVGNMVEQIVVSNIAHEEARQTKWLNVYNDKGKIAEARSLNDKEETELQYVYKYDEKGCISEEHVIDHINNTETTTQYEYTYDAYGNWIQLVTTTSSNETLTPYIEVKLRAIEYYK